MRKKYFKIDEERRSPRKKSLEEMAVIRVAASLSAVKGGIH